MRHLYDAPGWGVGEVWARDGLIVQHELASAALEDERRAALPRGRSTGQTARVPATAADLCDRVIAHLRGAPTSYDGIAIDLEWATPLQRELASAARAIPWGDVVSYGELAALAGRPGAARAAGSFCAENRFSLVIPCHRVVAANGIGGYGSAGVELKRRLLALEGVSL
jgi:methylated-DNA-[protein]-cysteine S-methyltransferase